MKEAIWQASSDGLRRVVMAVDVRSSWSVSPSIIEKEGPCHFGLGTELRSNQVTSFCGCACG